MQSGPLIHEKPSMLAVKAVNFLNPSDFIWALRNNHVYDVESHTSRCVIHILTSSAALWRTGQMTALMNLVGASDAQLFARE